MMENDPKNDLEKDGGGQMHMVSRKKVYLFRKMVENAKSKIVASASYFHESNNLCCNICFMCLYYIISGKRPVKLCAPV